MLSDAAEMGAKKALQEAGVLKPWLSKAEAYRKYGERTVKRWITERKIIPKLPSPNSVKKFISREEIEALAKSLKPLYIHS